MDTLSKIILDFIDNPSRMTTGAKQIANRYGVTIADIKTARQVARGIVAKTAAKDESKDIINGLHIISSDYHIPALNERLFNGFLNLLADLNTEIKAFHINGDFLDLNSLSAYDKGKFTAIEGLTLDKEYEAGNEALDAIDNVLNDKVVKNFLWGNHEVRYSKYMSNMDHAKTPLLSPSEGLKLIERGYNVITDEAGLPINNRTQLMHGAYWNEHSAKKHVDVFKKNVIYGHTHRISSYVEQNYMGINTGHMTDETSPIFNYANSGMKSKHRNGFLLLHVEGEDIYPTQIIATNNKFYYNNKTYAG